jgi:DNA-binding SARP family transcriptional activator
VGSQGLVARNRELADLDNALVQARRSRASAVLLRGEPGTGKTATIEATVARAIDFRVIELSGKDLEDSAQDSRPWPAELVELLENVPSYETDRNEMAGAEDALLAAAALSALASKSPLPLLVAIDDADQLPAPFVAALLTAVVTEMQDESLALFVAERTLPHAPPGELGIAGVSEHRLRGLTAAQTRDLFTVRQLPVPVRPVLDALHHATGGNPAALLDAHGRVGPDVVGGWRPAPEPVPVGPAIAGPYAMCLARFDDTTLAALAAAATASLPLALLERVLERLGLSRAALDPAARAGIIEVRSKRVQFAHPLVRVAAYQLAAPDVRTSMHEAVSDVYWVDGDVELSAFHAGLASTRRSHRLSRRYGEAARVALDRSDPRAAASHQEMAAEFGESDDGNAQQLARAAAGWLSAGERDRALVCLDRAERLDTMSITKAEIRYQRARVDMATMTDGRVVDGILEAAEMVEADDPSRALVMKMDAAACLALGGAVEGATTLAESASRLAHSAGNQAASLAEASRAALHYLVTLELEDAAALVPSTGQLVGQTYHFPASPHLAFVIGLALVDVEPRQAMRWASWIERCASAIGDLALASVPMALQGAAALRLGRLVEAESSSSAALGAADACGQEVLSAQALTLLVETFAAQGSYQSAFESASRLFGSVSERDGRLRSRAYVALAALDLQRGRTRSALAWLRAAESEGAAAELDGAHPGKRDESWLPALAEVLTVEGRTNDVIELAAAQAPAAATAAAGGRRAARLAFVRGLGSPTINEGAEYFQAALTSSPSVPIFSARVELGWGVRAAQCGELTEAAEHLEQAITCFEAVGATGWAHLAEAQLERLLPRLEVGPTGALTARATQPQLPERAGDTSQERVAFEDAEVDVETSTWEIVLLGSFSVRRNGMLVPNPPSLTTQALKVVALRNRVLSEELAELLWPGSAPGIGVRRLRNVLWRIRASCGDVLLRDENFILLAPEAVTDVSRMRDLAQAALDPTTGREKAADLAREALRQYKGELLPGDRYVDWPTSARESLARLQVQLLELLVTIAIDAERHQEALVMLESLTEADPYEERHYVRAAELYVRIGSQARALAMVSRGERMLRDLGMTPSSALRELRKELTTG